MQLPLVDVIIPHLKSPGAVLLRVVVELHDTTAIGNRGRIAVTLTGSRETVFAALTTGEDDPGSDTGTLEGTVTHECPTATARVPTEYERTFAVSLFSLGWVYEVTVTPSTITGTPRGVRRVSIYEHTRSSFVAEGEP